MAIKKITFKIFLFSLALVGFFTGLISRVFFGSSANLNKLESKSDSIFSKEASGSLISIARADYVSACSGSSDVNEDSTDSTDTGGCLDASDAVDNH